MTGGTQHQQSGEWEQQRERLSAYLDGEVDAAERAALEQHLPTCEPCQRALAWLAGGQVLLQRGALSRVYLAIEVGGEPFALLLPLAALLMLCAAGHILLSYLPLWLSFSTIRTPLHF